MDDWKYEYQTENMWNRRHLLYANRIIVLALVFGSVTGSHAQGVNCSEFTGCKKCSNEPTCSWSLETQYCYTDIIGDLIVHNEADCPEYSVWTNVESDEDSGFQAYFFQVTVSNDRHEFLSVLEKSRLTCWLNGTPMNGTVAENTILCGTDLMWIPKMPRVLFNYVMFDDNVLRLDDVGANYELLNRKCPGLERSYCTSCAWGGPNYINFYARCAANNTCTGMMEYYERRTTRSYRVVAVRKNADLRLRCPELSIVAVDPTSAWWNTATQVSITIGGHAILADGRDVNVTLAGRPCTGLSTLDERTLSCTLSPATEQEPTDSPVVVRYGRRTVMVSAQVFRSLYPELYTVSPVCGPLKGGTLLRIGGRSLNASTEVRVTVGAAALECRTTGRDELSIQCVTAPSAVPLSGQVMVLFDKSLSEHVVGPTFTYTDEAMPTVDEGQRYRIYRAIMDGHATVEVHGRHLLCVEKAEIYYLSYHFRQNVSCAVEDDTHMVCFAPGPGQWPTPDPDNFGFFILAANSELDICPLPDASGYFWSIPRSRWSLGLRCSADSRSTSWASRNDS